MLRKSAILAQLVEQRFCKPQVEGSSPSDGCSWKRRMNPTKIDPEILGGAPCFAGTRVPIRRLVDVLPQGEPMADFLKAFPSATPHKPSQKCSSSRRSG